MKKLPFFALFTFCFITAYGVDAISMEVKMAFVDMQIVEAKSVAVDDLIKKLEKEQIGLREKIDSVSKDLQRRARELESKKSVLSATAVEEQRRKLESDLVSLQTEAQISGENLQRARISSLSEVDMAVKDVVRTIAKKSGYDVVLPLHSTLYVADSKYPDITDEVVSKLNSSMKVVDLQKHLGSGSNSIKRVEVAPASKKSKK